MVSVWLLCSGIWMGLQDKKKRVKFCPRCGSANLGWLLPHDRQKWECKDCGYVGAFIVEDGKIAEEVRKEYLKNKNKIQE